MSTALDDTGINQIMEKHGEAHGLMHEKAFLRWINGRFHMAGQDDVHVDDLHSGFKDGTILVRLTELLSGRRALRYHEDVGNKSFLGLENIQIAQDMMAEDGGHPVASAKEIQEGNKKAVLANLWQLIHLYQLKKPFAEGGPFHSDLGGETSNLFNWLKLKTKDYPNVNINNLRSSWFDGMGLMALIHSYDPSLLIDHEGNKISEFNELDPTKQRENLANAFDLAEQHLGVPKMFGVDDILSDNPADVPDEAAFVTYLSLFPFALQNKGGKPIEGEVPKEGVTKTTPKTRAGKPVRKVKQEGVKGQGPVKKKGMKKKPVTEGKRKARKQPIGQATVFVMERLPSPEEVEEQKKLAKEEEKNRKKLEKEVMERTDIIAPEDRLREEEETRHEDVNPDPEQFEKKQKLLQEIVAFGKTGKYADSIASENRRADQRAKGGQHGVDDVNPDPEQVAKKKKLLREIIAFGKTGKYKDSIARENLKADQRAKGGDKRGRRFKKMQQAVAREVEDRRRAHRMAARVEEDTINIRDKIQRAKDETARIEADIERIRGGRFRGVQPYGEGQQYSYPFTTEAKGKGKEFETGEVGGGLSKADREARKAQGIRDVTV